MEEITTGAGLGAMGFWLFVAATVAAGVWDSIRKRDAQHETLRRVIESGQTIDSDLTDKLLAAMSGSQDLERDLRVSGLIMFSIAPGLAILGWVLSLFASAKILFILLAVAALVACIGGGLLLAARTVSRHQQDDLSAIQ